MRAFLIFAIICTFLVALAMAEHENLESSLRGEVENKIREKRQFLGRGGFGGGGFGGGIGGGGFGGRGFGGRGFGGGLGGGFGGGLGGGIGRGGFYG